MVQALNPPIPKSVLTLADFLAIPETKPASEFIDGEIIQKPMAKGKHRIVQRELTFTIDRPLTEQEIARAFPELRCSFGDRSFVPDISVFKTDRIPRDPNGTVANDFEIAPDWTIEILSPDQRHTKVIKNIVHCLQHGTILGWLIDPEERLPVPAFAQAIELTVVDLFGWLIK